MASQSAFPRFRYKQKVVDEMTLVTENIRDKIQASLRAIGECEAQRKSTAQLDDQIGEFLEDIARIQTSVVTGTTRDNHQMLRLFETMEHFIEPPKVRYTLTTNEPAAHFRHAQKASAVFCDGHVDREKPVPTSIDKRLGGQLIGRIRDEVLVIH